MMDAVLELPVVDPGEDARERSDAARNRRRIMCAAATLVAERGIEPLNSGVEIRTPSTSAIAARSCATAAGSLSGVSRSAS